MPLSSDDFTALIYLKNKVRKWKNISLIFIIISLFFVFNPMSDNVDSIDISKKDFIANISIEGIIFDDSYRNSILRKISKQDNVKAVIVNINSPGGGIVGSEIVYDNLRKIAEKKPIVVLMGSLAASGGYMAAIASDHIIARNGTLTGSIGVLMQSSEITDLADKLGVKFLTYKSSPLKGSPSPFEKSNPKVDEIINESIKDGYDFFYNLVLERRKGKIKEQDIQKIIDGRIFTGRQALKNGLVDEIGSRETALSYLHKKYKLDADLQVVDIDLKKPEAKLIEKLFGNDSFFNKIMNKNGGQGGLMAIWKL